MAEHRPPRPPRGLGTAGRALWRSIQSALDEGFELDEREEAILTLACRQADDVVALERALKASGILVEGSKGQPRLSAVVTELRQARLALSRLLGELDLSSPAQEEARPARSKRAQHAANVRWAQAAAKRARRARDAA